MEPSLIPLRSPVVSSPAVSFLVVSTFLQNLATGTVFLRFLSRRASSSVGPDDWLALLALVFSFGFYVIGVLLSTLGFAGFHTNALLPEQIERFLLYIYILHVFYALTLPTAKFSILLMYKRIFPTKRFQYTIYITGFLVLSWMIGVLFAQVFNCMPINAAWRPTARATARCINIERFYYGNAISNLLTDVIILCLPLPIIWGLNMSTNRKIALTGVFLLGSLVCISSIIRIMNLTRIKANDLTYTLLNVELWTSIETCLAITCACLPTLPTYLKTWRGNCKERKLRKVYRSGLRCKTERNEEASRNNYTNIERGVIPLEDMNITSP